MSKTTREFENRIPKPSISSNGWFSIQSDHKQWKIQWILKKESSNLELWFLVKSGYVQKKPKQGKTWYHVQDGVFVVTSPTVSKEHPRDRDIVIVLTAKRHLVPVLRPSLFLKKNNSLCILGVPRLSSISPKAGIPWPRSFVLNAVQPYLAVILVGQVLSPYT